MGKKIKASSTPPPKPDVIGWFLPYVRKAKVYIKAMSLVFNDIAYFPIKLLNHTNINTFIS